MVLVVSSLNLLRSRNYTCLVSVVSQFASKSMINIKCNIEIVTNGVYKQ